MFQKKKIAIKLSPPPKSIFENTMGNHFLKKKFVMIETIHKKIRIELWTFSFQICFRNQFRTSGSGKTEIVLIMPIGVIGVFSV